MASAFSQSTFLSADNMEPSLPPLYPHPQWDRKRGPSRERQPWLTLFLPPEDLPGPCAGMSIPELDWEASLAQDSWLPCRLLFGSWRWQELLALPGEQELAEGR